MSTWILIGFTADDIVMAGQDARLAQALDTVWRAAGRPKNVDVLQTPGAGDHLVYWYVSEHAAALMDEHGISWRTFVLATDASPPRDHTDKVLA